jgi:hypothetical protein
MASQRADRQVTYSGCCTNADFNVLSLRSRWRLAKGLHDDSRTSTNLVGGSVIAGLSVEMVPNSMGVGIFL